MTDSVTLLRYWRKASSFLTLSVTEIPGVYYDYFSSSCILIWLASFTKTLWLEWGESNFPGEVLLFQELRKEDVRPHSPFNIPFLLLNISFFKRQSYIKERNKEKERIFYLLFHYKWPQWPELCQIEVQITELLLCLPRAKGPRYFGDILMLFLGTLVIGDKLGLFWTNTHTGC